MRYAVVNAEYEHVLFERELGHCAPQRYQKLRCGRQYLFYYINSDPNLGLVSFWDMPAETIDYFAEKGIVLPKLVKDVPGENWYGLLSNIDLERKLNSKLEHYKFLEKQGDLPEHVHFVSNKEEILKAIKNSEVKTWILKAPFFCGGHGFKIIESEAQVPEKLPFPHILEPYLKRVADMAVYYDPDSREMFPYISYINPEGVYLGGRIYQNQAYLELELKHDGLYDAFMSVVHKAEEYLQELKKHPLAQPVTLDSFLYRDDKGKLKGYAISETNYRISMGTLNRSLRKFLPENGVGTLVATKKYDNVNWKTILPYSTETKQGVLSLNEGNPHGEVLLISAPNMNILKRYEKIVVNSEQ